MADGINLNFSASSCSETGSFRLLELPPELCKLIEAAVESPLTAPPSLTIKGQPNEDAVLCTADKTYTLRSVVLSNTVLVTTPAQTDGSVEIRDQLHEIVELVPTVPRIHKLSGMLRGMEYDEGDEDMDEERRSKRPRYSHDQAREDIQASDHELDQGLIQRRVLVIDGQLRPLASAHLSTILELLINYLISLSLSHQKAPVEELVSTLADEHEIPRQVSTQIMSWFGDINEGIWTMNVDAIIREIGLGILRNHKDEPISERDFISKWKNMVGDSFETNVQLSLLLGNYLTNIFLTSGPPVQMLSYFPSSALPVDPTARFADLFLTRPRWKSDEITPFLSDIAVNSKERDKLLLKFGRAITDPQGIWYTARTSYNG